MRQVKLQPKSLRRDPAPSRIRYRLQRLWLTPTFHALLRIGPIVAILGGLTHWAVTEPRVAKFVSQKVTETRESFANREEFKLTAIDIKGAGPELSFDVREAVDLHLPISSFDVDLDAINARIVALSAVNEARVKVMKGGVLDITVSERLPVALWRTKAGLRLIDSDGVELGAVDRRIDRTDLPLVSGEGAPAQVLEALQLFQAVAPLQERVRGLIRIGERRWDVILDRDQRILLPEVGAVQALRRVIGLDAADDILARDLSLVDIRNPERVTLGLNQNAKEELVRTRMIARGEVLE